MPNFNFARLFLFLNHSAPDSICNGVNRIAHIVSPTAYIVNPAFWIFLAKAWRLRILTGYELSQMV